MASSQEIRVTGLPLRTEPLQPPIRTLSLLEEKSVDSKHHHQQSEDKQHSGTDAVGLPGEIHDSETDQEQDESDKCHLCLLGIPSSYPERLPYGASGEPIVSVQEGVIKFQLDHQTTDLDPRRYGELVCKLAAWRQVMSLARLVGQHPDLYEGAGYGNVSARTGPPSAALGRRSFLITATQTSGKAQIDLRDFVVVERFDFRRNWVKSHGLQEPSSESMTHGAIYDQGPHIRCVLHAHSPELWRQARALRLPITDPKVAYGTPEMAREVQRLFRESAVVERQILAMGGHDDGILAFGRSPAETGQVLVTELARAFEIQQAAINREPA